MRKFLFKKIDQMTGRELFCVERLRCNTFVVEQKITLPELDEEDLKAIQVFALNQEQDLALATCRIFQNEHQQWMLGRVCVAKACRGQHLASKMLLAVHSFLKKKSAQQLFCHAQMTAVPFYQRLNYRESGPHFYEGGIEHVLMTKSLTD